MPRSKDARAATLSIRLLGPVEIHVDGEPLAVDTRKAIALLAYVAGAGRPTARESAESGQSSVASVSRGTGRPATAR